MTAYEGVTAQLLLDEDPEGARAWLRRLLTGLLTAGSAHTARPAPDDAAR